MQIIIKRVLLAATVICILLLVAITLLPLSYGSTGQYIGNATLQLVRSNGFARNALLLQHGTTAEQSQAFSDLQVSLPLFDREQTDLLRTQDPDAQSALQQARSSYLALSTAVNAIINKHLDSVQVEIVTQNSRAYNVAMNNFLLILQNQANDFNTHLVLLQEVFLTMIMLCFVGVLFVHHKERSGNDTTNI